MGNSLCKSKSSAVKPSSPPAAPSAKQPSRSASSNSRSSFTGSRGSGLGRISGPIGKLATAVGVRSAVAQAAAANSRHQLEERLAETIKAKAGAAAAPGTPARPTITFNRLLLRFPALHEGFAACRAVFRGLSGREEGEVSLQQLQAACTQLGYHADEASLRRIFQSADLDGSSSLNVHEFLVVLAILHILKGPEDEEKVDPCILRTWTTLEDAFMCFSSSKHGYIEKEELLGMMHEGATDGVRHSASGSGEDPIVRIAQQRFAELDRDGRGRVSFLEFLFCLEGWVEDAEEME